MIREAKLMLRGLRGSAKLFMARAGAALLQAAIMSQAFHSAAALALEIQHSQVEIAYIEPQKSSLRLYYDTLKRRQVLEQLQDFLSPLRLPKKILVTTQECGRETIPYEPGQPIVACYEYVSHIVRLAPQAKTRTGISRDTAIVGAFVQLILHETARAIFNLMQIPVWGREEDAADKLAAFVMLQFGKEVAITTLSGSVWFFEASNRTWTGSDFAQEDSPEAQRFFNYLCIAYGADPATFTEIARETLLRTRRAARCASEYKEISEAFTKTILPYVDPERLKRVQSLKLLRQDH
jgi:hypothetical protein